MSDPSSWLLALHAAAAGWMAAVGLMVQVLVYPAFLTVPAERWAAHHAAHSSRITPIVLPAMAVQLGVAGWLLLDRPDGVPQWTTAANAALVLATWLLTGLVSARQHTQLGAGHDPAVIRSLIAVNGVRTAAWLAHLPLAIWMVVVGS